MIHSEKKKPGRPKKKILTSAVETVGISNHPYDESHIMELVYSNPAMFKKIFQMYRSYEVSEIEMNFTADGLTIYAVDHLEKSKTYVYVPGAAMNLYYCKWPLRVVAKRENLERVVMALAKTTYKITFTVAEATQELLTVIMNDYMYNLDDIYDVDVNTSQLTAEAAMYDETKYPLHFKLDMKHFKNKINCARKISQVFTIQKCGQDPLQLTFDKSQRGTNWTGVYNDDFKMELKSTIGQNDILNVSVITDYIRPFSNSGIGEIVTISVDHHKPICLATYLDTRNNTHGAHIKIFTEIKDYR